MFFFLNSQNSYVRFCIIESVLAFSRKNNDPKLNNHCIGLISMKYTLGLRADGHLSLSFPETSWYIPINEVCPQTSRLALLDTARHLVLIYKQHSFSQCTRLSFRDVSICQNQAQNTAQPHGTYKW